MEGVNVGDHVVYVGGGRFKGDKELSNGHMLFVGAEGIIHSILTDENELRCTFGQCRVSLDAADVQLVSASALKAGQNSVTSSTSSSSAPATSSKPRSQGFVAAVRSQTTAARHTQSPHAAHARSPSGSRFHMYETSVDASTNSKAGRQNNGRRSSRGNIRPVPPTASSSSSSSHGTFARPGRTTLQAEKPKAEKPKVEKPKEEKPSELKTFRKVSVSETGLEWDADKKHPPSFYCPISHRCMHDPVVLTDGHTYERRHIEQWLKDHHTSPVSGARLPEKKVFPNHALRNSIEEYFEQVRSCHRKAIRSTVSGLRREGSISSDATLLQTIDSLMQCSVLMNADLCIERVLQSIMHEAKSLVGAEIASVFLVDRARQELYSTVNSTGGEIRIPISSGIAGRVASTGKPLIIKDAYCDCRFNTKVDLETGFKTRSILCVPIKALKWGVIGVAQLINKTGTGVLMGDDGSERQESTKVSFTVDDQHFLQVLSSQAAVAIINSGIFDPEQSQEKPAMSGAAAAAPSGQTAGKETPSEANGLEAEPVSGKTTPDSKELDPATAATNRAVVKPLLSSAFSEWETDVLSLAELNGNRPLSTLTAHLFECHELVSYFGLDKSKLLSFLDAIEDGYLEEIPYHNRSHAASVVHVMHALLHHGCIASLASRAAAAVSEDSERQRKLVILAGLMAAAVHDYEHLGLTNDFLVKTDSSRAVRYNDKSPNENHHVSAAFEVLQRPELNFLEALPKAEYRQVRKLVVDMVLATDMAENNRIVDAFKQAVTPSTDSSVREKEAAYCAPTERDAMLVLQMALKCADIGHLSLSWNSHIRWVRRLEKEFFLQGDKEKKYGFEKVSFLMDRAKPGVQKSQVGFFDFVVLPMFQIVLQAFPATLPLHSAVLSNYQHWRAIEAELKVSDSPDA